MNNKLNQNSQIADRESRHQCLVYAGAPSRQLPALAATVKRKLDEGYRCLYLNSRPMVAGIRSCLAAIGMDVVEEVARTRLLLSSELVASADGGFNAGLMLRKLEEALDQALNEGFKGLWATGDMTWEFGAEKNFSKLMDYERRLEALFSKRHELCGICQYHQDTLPREATKEGLLTHQTVYVNQTLSRMNPYYAAARPANGGVTTEPDLEEMLTTLQLPRGQA